MSKCNCNGVSLTTVLIVVILYASCDGASERRAMRHRHVADTVVFDTTVVLDTAGHK